VLEEAFRQRDHPPAQVAVLRGGVQNVIKLIAGSADEGLEQLLLGTEVIVERALGPAEPGGDGRHRRPAIAFRHETFVRHVQDGVPTIRPPGLLRRHAHRYSVLQTGLTAAI
jgi:hypothetical protein